MVGEFPELQGIIGSYYAQADGEDPQVCTALRHQYALRLQQPVSADKLIAAILFVAERIDTLVGIWGIGLAPTGERDPYALRRAALGLISAYEQLQAGGQLATNDLDLQPLLAYAAEGFAADTLAEGTLAEVQRFIYERYRTLLIQSTPRAVVEAVLSTHPPLAQVPRSEEHTSELPSRGHLVCRLLLDKNKRVNDCI